MTGLLVIANLVLFVGLFVGAFALHAFLTSKTIGFFNGARFAVLTEGDIKARKKFNLLTLAYALVVGGISLALYFIVGAELWSTWALGGTIGAILGTGAHYKMNYHRLKPVGW